MFIEARSWLGRGLFVVLFFVACTATYADGLMTLLRMQQEKNAYIHNNEEADADFSSQEGDELLAVIRAIQQGNNGLSLNNGQVNLRQVPYSPALASAAAIIVAADTHEVLYRKNSALMLPIASLSKLMSAMVVLDAKQNMQEKITITAADVDYLKKSGSRLSLGTQLTRQELLHLSLMSSENRAMHALARTYPGGVSAFVTQMNRKAQALGMRQSIFYEPTGLDPRNQSTAEDIVKMVEAAYRYLSIRQFSTATEHFVKTASGRTQRYRSSNSLVREGSWQIGLQKTGYIREAGRCMAVHTQVAERPLIMVLLDAPSSYSRTADAKRVHDWVGDIM